MTSQARSDTLEGVWPWRVDVLVMIGVVVAYAPASWRETGCWAHLFVLRSVFGADADRLR
jgi:hypothetical protein